MGQQFAKSAAMNFIRVLALPLVLGLVACDEPPKPPVPVPEPPKTETAPTKAQPAEPADPAPVVTNKLVPEKLPVAVPKPQPEPAEAVVRAAPPDKAPAAARVIPKAAEKAANKQPKLEPLPEKLDLRLPKELVETLEPAPQEQQAEQGLLPPLFVEKQDQPGPYQINGRLITNDREHDYLDSVEGAELQIEFRK